MKKQNWFRRRVERRRNSATAKPQQRRLLCEILEQRALMAAYITEVHPSGSGTAYGADWFEVTNTGPGALNITGWKVDDSSAAFGSAVALRGVTSIAAGQSMIFFEGLANGSTDATIVAAINSAWGTSFVFGVDIGAYGGSGIGLGTGGDAVNLYNSAGTLQAAVTFGAATTGRTFDNAANLNGTVISQLSTANVNGAYVSNIGEIGSPGLVSAANSLPVAQASGVTTTENTAKTFAVGDFLFTDAESNPLASITVSNLTLASGDTLTVDQGSGAVAVTNGMTITAAQIASLTYTPATGANGAARSTFDFKVNDADSGTVAATMTINVSSVNNIDLSIYVRVGRYDLPEPTRTTPPANSVLAQEVSAVTYNWDTDTLFVVGDGGTSVVQVSKTGQLINSMTLATGGSPQGTEFYDPEGLMYVGAGKFVMVEERDRQAVLFTYVADTVLTRAAAQTVKLGTFVQNIGIEGMTYDPLTGGYIAVKETQPQGIFQTNIDFDAGTATNGSPTTENSTNLFDPAVLNLLDLADVFALSNLSFLNGQAEYSNLLVLSHESGKILHIDRSGNIFSSLTILNDPGNPLSVPAHQHEGLTMDNDGFLYVVSENGGGDFDHPQLWVYAPSSTPNAAPTGLALNNQVNAIDENTSTTTRIKVADVVITDDGIGTNNLTVSGTDAAFFEVDSNGLYIKAGTTLDFETKSSYSVTVNVDDPSLGATPDATANFTLSVTDLVNENPNQASLFISEVAPWSSGNSPINADWFEVTNTGSSAINITGWKFDDSSGSFASAVALSGITSIAAGESVIFIESADLTAAAAAFRNTWFGGNAPAGLQIGNYTGGGVGLSTGGDAINLYNSTGVLQANITFGTSPAGPSFPTFNNAAAANNTAVSQLSAVGVNGAFVAVNDPNEIGSPGTVGRLFISEVAPWSSSSPVGADWFELTNTTAFAIDITGWKFDDASGSFAASVALTGITSIAAGESVIFLETSNLTAAAASFRSTWFGANAPVGLQIGGYTGSGVGLSTGGDAVHVYNSTGQLQASVSFGASPAGPSLPTFNNAAALNGTAVSQLSTVGVNGAFAAVNDPNEIGSPGSILTVESNDAPVHTVPGTQSANSGATLTFNTAGGNKISIADPDAGSGLLQTKLTAFGGTLSLSTTAGLSFSAGSGSGVATMTFTGTLSAINAALDGLQFTATAGFSGAGSLRIETSDQGNSGGAAQTDDDTITINVNAAPTIVGVYARGSDWSGSFTTYLSDNNLGDATLGYELSNGSNQLRTLPWTNVNTVGIQFNEAVVIEKSDLTLVGASNGQVLPSVAGATFSWNETTFVATWTFATALPRGKILLHLGSGVGDAAGAVIDGEWTVSSSTSSGNGLGGGDFNFRFNVLPGDIDGNNSVGNPEILQARLDAGKGTASTGYNPRKDLDGNGTITNPEILAARSRAATSITGLNEPIAPGGGPLTAASPSSLPVFDESLGYVSPYSPLTQAELAPIVAEAIARWEASGLIPAGTVDWSALRFEITDLGPSYLGLFAPQNTVQVDDDGAGWGWFVDATPQDDAEFAATATPQELSAQSGSAAAGRMDLLTTVMHEIGHYLGYDLNTVPAGQLTVMTEQLATGDRRTFATAAPTVQPSVLETTFTGADTIPEFGAFITPAAIVVGVGAAVDLASSAPSSLTASSSTVRPEHAALAMWAEPQNGAGWSPAVRQPLFGNRSELPDRSSSLTDAFEVLAQSAELGRFRGMAYGTSITVNGKPKTVQVDTQIAGRHNRNAI